MQQELQKYNNDELKVMIDIYQEHIKQDKKPLLRKDTNKKYYDNNREKVLSHQKELYIKNKKHYLDRQKYYYYKRTNQLEIKNFIFSNLW